MRHHSDDSDYYAVLGVPPTANPAEIRGSYRQLALRHHPDVNPPDQDDTAANEFMRQLNEAYDTLSGPLRRATYDRQHRPPASDWSEPDGRQAGSRCPPPGDLGWDAQAPGQPRRYRSFRDLMIPDWLNDLMLAEERLRGRLRPLGVWVGMLMPIVVTAALIVVGFWLYMQLRADPQSWALVTYVNQLLGGTAGFAFVGILMLLLGVGVILWRFPRH